MLTIDVHTHILPEEIPSFKDKFGYGGFIQLDHSNCHAGTARMVRDDGHFFRQIASNCWCPQTRLADLERTNVSVQVLSTVPVMFCYGAQPQDTLVVAQFLNDHIAQVVDQYPKKFCGLATLPLQDTRLAKDELKRCIEVLGLSGIQIGTHCLGKNLNHPDIFEVFALCEALGACVFVHPWDMLGQDRMTEYWLPWLVGMPTETSLAICSMIFSGVFERLPKLKVAFAHGGGSFPGTIGRIEHGYQVRPDLCAQECSLSPRQALGRFYVDSLVHENEALHSLVKLFGEDRILLGSDYPFPLGEHHPGALINSQSGFNQQVKAKLLGLNALEWLGRSAQDFAP